MHFDNVFEKIKTNKKRRDEGKFNSIPFGLTKLNKVCPGITRGVQYNISASSGVVTCPQ